MNTFLIKLTHTHTMLLQDWTKPVGYHVTLPCSKAQAGYRTFNAAFAMDKGDGSMNVVQMKYQHTMLRDQDTYHSRWV